MTRLLALVLVLAVVAASRPADQPAPIARVATGFEQGTPTPAAGPRIAAPVDRAAPPAAVFPDAAAGTLPGLATWYGADGMIAAAGPALRRWLGRDWRGSTVRVSAGGRWVTVVLSDWCACGPRGGRPTVIDLSDDAFRELAPLPTGVLRVTVAATGGDPAPTAPATDAEP